MSTRKKSPKKSLLTLGLTGGALATILILLTGAGTGFTTKMNDFLRDLIATTSKYNEHLPEDRVYLHFDKPFYKPGEDVWFSAYIRDAASMQPSKKSEILHVQLLNPKGNIQQEYKLTALDGFTKGDFHIDEAAVGGMYKVKAFTKWQDNMEEAFVFEKEIQVQKVVLPNLKMKLDFDRKAYGSGDEVTATLNLQTNANEALGDHDFKYVASLDGQPLSTLAAKTDGAGKATLKFELPEGLSSNDGLVNVMIQYKGLTESISRAIPIVLNKIDLELFAEGGDLVEGIRSRVAFRARNEFNKPADIEGVVVDDEGSTVARFNSYHQGMGAFEFKPIAGRSYTAKITRPEGITEVYELPEALPRGYVLNVKDVTSKQLFAEVKSTENEALNLVAMVRGEIYWASEIDVLNGKAEVDIPLDDFPMGVCQLTLFDSKGIPRSERLAFVNRDRQLDIQIETDKDKYLPREKVELTVKVRDERGMPMPAQLSLSAVNDQLLSFADDKSGNILSQLLLEPDLKQEVEEPAFYFKKEEEKSLAALDYLLMTSGWRRFKWEEVQKDRLPNITHPGELAQISGRVLDAYSGQPVPYASIMAKNNNIGLVAGKDGSFQMTGLDLGLDMSLTINADEYTPTEQIIGTYEDDLVIYLYNNEAQVWGGGGFDDWGDDDFDGEMMGAAEEVVVMDMAPMKAAPVARDRGAKRAMKMKADAPMPMAVVANAIEPQPDLKVAENKINLQEAMNKDFAFDGIEKEAHPEDQREFNRPERAPEEEEEVMADFDAFDGEFDEGFVGDLRFEIMANQDKKALENVADGASFYRAREFAAPVYTDGKLPQKRTDFRSTVYWNPAIEVDRTGKAKLEFYMSDEITSFRLAVEGIGRTGMVGRTEKTIYTQLPFSMNARVPAEVAANDKVVVPIVLTNNTQSALSGSLHIIPPIGLTPLTTPPSQVSIPAGQAKSVFVAYEVGSKLGESDFEIAFTGEGQTDAFKQPFKVVPQGFPVNLSYAGNELSSTYKFQMSKVVPGSVSAQLTAYPNVVSDLVKGIESILREPYGCFEQTSTSSYPNALVMNYMIETDNVDQAVMDRAAQLLDKGYKRLATFECSDNGYEWFGSNPPHEALSAYGLMQFSDYQEVYDGVDQKMVSRTSNWLMSRRDGKGGFKRSGQALDQFGRASDAVTNAYIVWALSEAGNKEIMPEANATYDAAMKSKDPYTLGLVANAMANLGQQAKSKEALKALLATQAEDGSFTGKEGSITRSGGISLKVETTSIAVLAMLSGNAPDANKLTRAVEFIVGSRSGHGGFGSTQATILGLKSLVAYAKFAKQTDESGTIEVYVNGQQVASQAYAKGAKDAIEIKGLEAHLTEGKHKVEVRFNGCKKALPYSLAVDYNTTLPPSSPKCVVELSTELSTKRARMGETVRLSAELKNRTQEGQPMTMAILGLPAGLSAQPWQLKELQEKKVFDFYEVVGNNVVCYYRQMKPGETREINLDLKAEVPGQYTAPASSAYLYYTAEFKDWTAPPTIEIMN